MRRRQFLVLSSAGAIPAISGCSSISGDSSEDSAEESTTTETQEETPTETPNETTTETPEPAEFEITDLTPDSAELGEKIQLQARIENVGGQGGTFERDYKTAATNGVRPEPEDYQTFTISMHVPANDSQTWESNSVTYNRPAVLYYQIDGETEQEVDIPASREPIIQETNLVSEWNSFGDGIDNKITQAEVGSEVSIAFRYWYWSENQSLDVFRQIEIYDESDDRVDIKTTTDEQVTQTSGWSQWESNIPFNTTEWDPGTYTAEAQIRDNQNNEVSGVGTVEFEMI